MGGIAAGAQGLADQRAKFHVDDEVAYFNTSTLSPLLRSVRTAGEESLDRRAKPWSISASDWFTDVEELRSRFARLIGETSEDVALVPATSFGLAVAARNLTAGPGDRVLVLDQEFPSNYYTWQRFARRTGAELLVVEREPRQSWTEAILGAIDERLAIASVPNVHWTNGALVDLEPVTLALREAGSAFIIDASQSLGAMPLAVAALRPQALVAVGYKWLLGPVSLGFLYLDPGLHDGEPLEENWILRAGSEDFTGLVDYVEDYLPGARRFDVGQRSNFQLVPMASAAVHQLLEWSIPDVTATLQARTRIIAAVLPPPPQQSGGHHPPRRGRCLGGMDTRARGNHGRRQGALLSRVRAGKDAACDSRRDIRRDQPVRSQGIRVSLHRNGRVPGSRVAGGVSAGWGAFAVTNRRVIGSRGKGKWVDVPFDLQSDGLATFTLDPAGLHVRFDLDRVHPSCHGEMRIDFREELPEADLARFPTRQLSFAVDPRKVVRLFGSLKKLPE